MKKPLVLLLITIALGCVPEDPARYAGGESEAAATCTNCMIVEGDYDAPAPIETTGASLFCAQRKAATDTDLESEFGCRLNAAGTNNKLEITNGIKISWASSITENVRIDDQTTNPAWHAIYAVKGATKEAIRETARAMNVQVKLEREGDPAPLLAIDQPLKDSLGSITDSGDLTAPIITQGLDPQDPGVLTDGLGP